MVNVRGLHAGFVAVTPVAAAPFAVAAAAGARLLPPRLRPWGAAVAAAVVALSAPAYVRRRHDGTVRSGVSPFTVVSSNLWYLNTDAPAAAEMVGSFDADVVICVEKLDAVRDAVPAGWNQLVFHRFDPPNDYELVVRSPHPLLHVGDVEAGSRAFPLIVVETPSGPTTVVPVHTTAPVNAVKVRKWKRQLRGLAVKLPSKVAKGMPLVVAGDFNASVTHSQFRRLVRFAGLFDAAQWHRAAWKGTWGPPRLRVPVLALDHILFSDHFGCSTFSTGVLPGSDHRFVKAVLTPTTV